MEAHVAILLNLGLVAYVAAILLAFSGIGTGSRRSFHAGRRVALLAAFSHVVMLVDMGLRHDYCPVMNVFGFVILLSIFVIAASAATEMFFDMAGLTVTTVPVALVFAFFAAVMGESSRATPEGAASLAAAVHIGVTLLSFGLFALAFVCAWLYLFERGQLKKKPLSLPLDFLPSLQSLYRLNLRFTLAGIVLLAMGTAAGILTARSVPNHPPHDWRHDPKVIATLLTWYAYVGVWVSHFIPYFKGRKTAWACVGAFFLLILGLWVTAYMSPLHNFR